MSHPLSHSLLAILCATGLGGLLPAADYYVAATTTASDSKSGSADAPWRTIQHAANVMVKGDTVHVLPGVYNAAISVTRSGSSTQRIRFVSDTRGAAKMNVAGVPAVWSVTASYIDVVGFDISSTDTTTNGARMGVDVSGSYCRVMGNVIHDIPAAAGTGGSGGAGIGLGTYPTVTTGNQCIGNFVHHIGPRTQNNKIHGIYVRDRGCLVANNITCDNSGSGVTSWHYATNMIVVNNLVFGNAYGGIVVGGGDVTNGGTLVANNIVINNSYAYGISEYGKTGTDNRYLNNCTYGNTNTSGQVQNFKLNNGLVARNTVTANARFVNYKADGTGDYHLAAGSPCIDAGIQEGTLPTDFDGHQRDAKCDIGPYEYASSANHAPVAQAQTVTTAEDTAKAVALVATDADGNALTYAIVAGPAHGVLSGSGASRTYTPSASYSGSDSFTFKANDGTADSNTATVSITVTAVGSSKLTLSVDNQYTDLYVNGVRLTPGANASNWRASDSFTISGTVSSVAVRAVNFEPGANWAGLIAKITQPDGTVIVSDSSWMVYSGTPANDANGRSWYDPNYDDSRWSSATSGGAYGVAPWGTQSGLSGLSGAQWIWSGTLQFGVSPVYLRKHIGTLAGAAMTEPAAPSGNG